MIQFTVQGGAKNREQIYVNPRTITHIERYLDGGTIIWTTAASNYRLYVTEELNDVAGMINSYFREHGL